MKTNPVNRIELLPSIMEGQLIPSMFQVLIDGAKTFHIITIEDGRVWSRALRQAFASLEDFARALFKMIQPEASQEPDSQEASEEAAGDEWNEDRIITLIRSNDRAAQRAIVALYESQDDDQKSGRQSGRTDGCGFSRFDRATGNRLAMKVKRGFKLSQAEQAKAAFLAHRYRKQLIKIANAKGGK